MEDPFKKYRKCQFCRQRDSALLYVPRRGIYGGAGWFYAYHKSCLRDVACDPEKYSSILVDMAVEIIDLIKVWKKDEERQKKDVKEKCKFLKEQCIKSE